MTGQWLRFALLPGLFSAALTSQAQKATPLHTFFQQNFDSTLIYQSSSNRNPSPNYLILAKYQDRLEFFTYASPYRDAQGHYYPGKLSRKFMKEESRFRSTLPDTNRYLLPKLLLSETLHHGWKQLNPTGLWTMKGEQQAQRSATKSCMIEDGEESTFYLIHKQTIRVAHFYSPEFYEQCAGSDSNRQQAIHARNTLQMLLQHAK